MNKENSEKNISKFINKNNAIFAFIKNIKKKTIYGDTS